MFASAKGKQQKQVRQLQCQEQCIDHIPYYLSGLSRAHFFPTTFLKIAVWYAPAGYEELAGAWSQSKLANYFDYIISYNVQQAPVPVNARLAHFCILPLYALPRVTFYIFITKPRSKYTTSILYVPGTCYDKKTLLNIWLNPGLNLTIYSRTGVTEEIRLTPFSTDAIVTAQISSEIKQPVNKKRLAI